MAKKQYYLTLEGLEEKKNRLENLIKVVRAEMAEQVKIAREHGDISENAEYDAAKNAQGEVEDEIKYLENMIDNAVIIESSNQDIISMGDFVKVKDLDNNEETTYQLVGSAEANFSKKRISNESPIGKALLGRKAGEKITVEAPKGNFPYEIISIGK